MPPATALRPVLTLFTRQHCGLCEAVKDTLTAVQKRTPFTLREIDIDESADRTWFRKYNYEVPVVHGPGDVVLGKHRVSESDVERWLIQAAVKQ
ncbi:hypothetical protein HDU86_003208 [Geranomyces michiganensis]|nr:hypothetical protein HDU86_003208 [Geranomyces michiganensis]